MPKVNPKDVKRKKDAPPHSTVNTKAHMAQVLLQESTTPMTATTSAKDSASNGNQPSTIKFSEDEVKRVPLGDIFVDHEWNARSIANVMAESSELGDKEGTGISGLMQAIVTDGQDEPVVLRKTGEGFYKKVPQPYALVAGFRRYEAIKRANADADLVARKASEGKPIVPNTTNGTIRAVVRALTELESRSLNTRENTARDDLSPPDLMFAISELVTKHKMTGLAISNAIGKAQGYVNKLTRIATVDPKILHHWRNGGDFAGIKSNVRITTNDLLDISKLDRAVQVDEYTKILNVKTAADDKDGNLWKTAAKKKAAAVGTMLGTLQREKFLKISSTIPWTDVVDSLVKIGKKKLGRREERMIADAAEKAFSEALIAKPKGEEEDEDGEDDKN